MCINFKSFFGLVTDGLFLSFKYCNPGNENILNKDADADYHFIQRLIAHCLFYISFQVLYPVACFIFHSKFLLVT